MIEFEKPNIECLAANDEENYAKFVCEPLERGYGMTIGNSLRRILLSSLPGAAITSVKIEGVLHEFSSIPNVIEDVPEIIVNLKSVRLKMHENEVKTIKIDFNGEGEVKQCLSEDKTLRIYVSDKGKLAITQYKCLKVSSVYSLMDVLIKTGRRNQIRVCFSSLGHPIIGDKKYGAKRNPIGRLGLHAYYLEFKHPVSSKNIVIEDEIPANFKVIFESATKK